MKSCDHKASMGAYRCRTSVNDRELWSIWLSRRRVQQHMALAGRLGLDTCTYHVAKKDGILTKSLWTRICNAMRLPMKIRESSTFEYVVQPTVLGSQVPERAVFQVLINFSNMHVTREVF